MLFDWDGTLMDTEPSTTTAWRTVLTELDIQLPDPLLRGLFHLGWPAAYECVAAHGPVPAPRLVLDRLAETRRALPPPRLFDDALPTIERLRDLGVRTAIVTNSDAGRLATDMAGARLAAAGFAAIVTADTVDRPKPAPDPYLRAMDLLARPESVVAIEDSAVGVTSATTAGVPALLVDRTAGAENGVTPTLRGLDADRIIAFLDGRTP